MGSQKKPKFRGGRKSRRDRWFGFDDDDFRRWWHRVGKRRNGGRNLKTKEEAQQAWQDYLSDQRSLP